MYKSFQKKRKKESGLDHCSKVTCTGLANEVTALGDVIRTLPFNARDQRFDSPPGLSTQYNDV